MYLFEYNDVEYEIVDLADLKNIPTSALVFAYNEVTGKSISKFSDRTTAEERTWVAIQDVAAAPEPVVETTAKRRASFANDLVCTYVVPENPKRPGKDAYDRFMKYRVGMTVKQLKGAGVTPADMKYDTDREFVKLEKPSAS